MNKIKKHRSISGICDEINLIIDNQYNNAEFKHLSTEFRYAIQAEIEYSDILVLCDTVIKVGKIKNRKLRYLEKEFWKFITEIPFRILIHEGDMLEDEEIKSNTDYSNPKKKILSRLIGLSKEILEVTDIKTKSNEFRRTSALKLIAEMVNYYNISDVKNIFLNSIKSKNKSEQQIALEGLESYYQVTENEIDEDLIKVLNEIFKQTNDRIVASICLQIQINAGIVDEFDAILQLDDWKEDHWN